MWPDLSALVQMQSMLLYDEFFSWAKLETKLRENDSFSVEIQTQYEFILFISSITLYLLFRAIKRTSKCGFDEKICVTWEWIIISNIKQVNRLTFPRLITKRKVLEELQLRPVWRRERQTPYFQRVEFQFRAFSLRSTT